MIYKICKSEEKQMILDIVITALFAEYKNEDNV